MNARILASGLIAGAVLPVALATAQPLGVPPGRWWDRPAVAEKLALTEEQKGKLEAAALANAKTMVDLKADVEKAEIDLKAAAEAESFDAGKVRAAFKAFQEARVRLESQRFEMLLAFREVLTTPQWKALQELARDRMRERRGEGAEGEPRQGMRPGRLHRP